MLYVKPNLTVFSAETIRVFKAAAASCVSQATACSTAACTSSSQENKCQSKAVSCTTSGAPRR